MSMLDWIWQGYPGHYCCADKCQFRLCTVIKEKFIVSTVGDMRLEKGGEIQEVGCGRKFETMVFNAKKCDCGCGEFVMDSGIEIDFLPANDPKEAKKNHYELCEKYYNEN